MMQEEVFKKPQVYRTNMLPLLIIAIIIAAFLRFFKLDQIPPGLTFDEAGHALDALDILNGNLMLISPRLQQAPAGYMYFLAGAFQLFGVSILVQRALSASFGLLMVPVNYFTVRQLFNKESSEKAAWIAGFSTLLIATSFWGIMTSRKGFEYIVPPVFALIAIYLFWHSYRNPRWGLLFLSAFFTAIGFYTYTGGAAFLLVIPTSLFLSLILHRILPTFSTETEAPSWRIFIFFSLAVALFASPMFLRLTTGPHPEVARSLGLYIFNRANNSSEAMHLLIDNLVAYAQPFLALGGDLRWYSNLPGHPILNPVLAISFIIGIFICLKRIRQLPYLFLLVYWGGMVAPAALTVAGNTISAFNFRLFGALPATYIFVALAWVEFYCWLKVRLVSISSKNIQALAPWLTLAPLFFISLIWLPVNTYRDYFLVWANQPEVREAHDVPILTLIERMERETDPEAIFILPRDARTPRPNFTLDFLYHGQVALRYLVLDEETVRHTLTTELSGYQTVHLITRLEGGRERFHKRAAADPFWRLLFEKYGELQNVERTEAYTIQTYRLDTINTDFEAHLLKGIPPRFEPLALIIGDQVKLAGIKQHLEGNTLFVDLAWQGWLKASDVTADYTVFIQLLDHKGQRVTGVDVLPERGFTKLDRREVMIINYAIPLSDEMRPGNYTMLIGLYYFVDNELVNVGTVTLAEPVILE